MIVAVVDPRGPVEAAATLALMAPAFGERHEDGNAVVATVSSDVAERESVVDRAITLEHARDFRGGALCGLAPDVPGALVLARGALGGRPLYYARTDHGGWVASSRIEPILRATARRYAPDPDRLAALAAGVASPRAQLTPYVGISRVEPCTAVRLRASARTNAPSARVEIALRPPRERSLLRGGAEELARELWARVERAVAGAVADAKSIAVMVGGGVDSSALLVAAIAAARGASPREVHALTLDFDATGSDRPYLSDLARELGIVPVRIAPREASSFYRQSFVVDAQPYILSIGPMEQRLFARAKELGADVVLTGYLADEVLAGEPRALSTLVGKGRPLEALRAAMSVRLPWPSSPVKQALDWVVRPHLKPLMPRALSVRNGLRASAATYPWAGPRLESVLAELVEITVAPRPPYTPEHRFDRLARAGLYADYADWRGQLETATGMARRDPFADEDVLDLLARVSPEQLCHGGIYRGLFRAAAGDRLPISIRQRTDKCCFEPAFAEVAEAAGGLPSLGDLWRPRALERLGVLDAAAFEASMAPLFRDPRSSTEAIAILWSLATQVIACESFARSFEAAS